MKLINAFLVLNLLNIIISIGSGRGWASRYWDCCKPSCSWTNNSGEGNEAKSCYKDGTIITDSPYEQSICTGNGKAHTCMFQIDFHHQEDLIIQGASIVLQALHFYWLLIKSVLSCRAKLP